jgi:hypothetical protein
MIVPSINQIKAQVTTIRKKSENAKFIGIHTSGQWISETVQTDGDITIYIHPCKSPLAIRLIMRDVMQEAIRNLEQDRQNNKIHVLLTPLEDNELGEDILMRLAKRKLLAIDAWEVVKSLFQANAIDPRLRKERWIAEYLIDWSSTDSYAPVSNGFLDAETVWTILLNRGLDISDFSPDLPYILKWSIDNDRITKLKTAPPIFQQAVIAYLTNLVGRTAHYILRCACQTERNDLVSLGLVFGVLFHPQASGKLDKAIGKIEERYLQGESLTPDLGIAWRDATQEVIQWRLSSEIQQRSQILHRADEILQEVGASHLAHLSEILPLGFHQRLESFGQTLSSILKKSLKNSSGLKKLLACRHEVLGHTLAKEEQYRSRINNLDMAIRLCKWVQQQTETNSLPQSLTDAISIELSDNCFADWARHSLIADEPLQILSAAYAELFNLAVKAREDHSQNFAHLFASWTELGSNNNEVLNGVLVVENVLKDIVAPIVSHNPVLLIVLDGMSMSVCFQLLENITRQGWLLLHKEDRDFPVIPVLATVPSITEISRTSLLCGRVRSGSAKDETSGFTFHPDLNEHSKQQKKQPPLLFHKAHLKGEEDVSLSENVRQAIASRDRLVIGVVVNAIDDRLTKGEQLHVDWTHQSINLLPALFYEAKISDRIVILASDHGHIIEHGTKLISTTEGGERWRPDDGNLTDQECRLTGSRVVASEHRVVIAPWSEQLRYKPKKNGYHGGVNPQELVTPVAVLSSGKSFPSGWIESLNKFPSWWNI